MCLPKRPKPPQVVERDPVKESAEAERVAGEVANQALSARRKTFRASSLSTFGGRGQTGAASQSYFAQAAPKP